MDITLHNMKDKHTEKTSKTIVRQDMDQDSSNRNPIKLKNKKAPF